MTSGPRVVLPALLMLAAVAACGTGTPVATGTPKPTHAPGETRTDPSGVVQVWVPAGSFTMGTTDAAAAALRAQDPPAFVARELPSELPAHDVTLSTGYWIDRDEVTNAAFGAFVDAGGYTTRELWSEQGWAWLQGRPAGSVPAPCASTKDAEPRACITWYEAEAYAAWRGGRLPTEAEWEFAARGPDSRVYPWGDAWDASRANVVGAVGAIPVGSLAGGASWVGARDMAGNVMEWVADWLDVRYYASSPATDPTGPAAGRVKVEKGGWWGANEFVARAAYRHYEDPPTYQDHHIGVRIVSAG